MNADEPANVNEFGQPIGPPVPNWHGCDQPPRTPMLGRYCRLEPLDAERHGAGLFEAFSAAPDARDWTYLFSELPVNDAAYREYLTTAAARQDPLQFTVVELTQQAPVGIVALMRIDPAHGVIEVGGVTYSRQLQKSKAGTEVMYLLMRRVFDELGYRRFEWKCDSLNAPSITAAHRLGFQFEGIFRQAIVYKGRSRDTAWFSIIDTEWPRVRVAFEQWLDDANFDETGNQRRRLAEIRKAI